MFFVMEYLSLGSLHAFLKNSGSALNSDEMLKMCVHISRGMSYLHEKNILHNDLAARNILMTKNDIETDGKYLLKVSDFGLSFKTDTNYVYGDESSRIPIRYILL